VPVADAWERYREMRTSAHTGESEVRALEDAFLSGACAAFDTLDALLRVAEDDSELALLLARWRLDLAIDESD
jgi:hypothetical protein